MGIGRGCTQNVTNVYLMGIKICTKRKMNVHPMAIKSICGAGKMGGYRIKKETFTTWCGYWPQQKHGIC